MTVHPAPGPVARLLWIIIDSIRPPVVVEGVARLCDWDHGPFVSIGGEGELSYGRAPVHIDVDARVHNRGQQVVTIIGIREAFAGSELQLPSWRHFADVTVEPGGPREDLKFSLSARAGDVTAAVDDAVAFKLRLTRGSLRAPRAKLKIAEDLRSRPRGRTVL